MTFTTNSLDTQGLLLLAEAIGETPETLMTREQLRRGLCRATVIGAAEQPAAAIVQPDAFPGDATAYGDDPDLIWALLRDLAGWESVDISSTMAPLLAERITAATGRLCRHDEEIFFVLEEQIAPWPMPAVRRLTRDDVPLMEAATAALTMGDWRFGSADALIADGFAAGAVIEDELVAVGFTAARGERYADIGIVTRDDWRNRGFSTAAAALVCADIQAAGQIPVWGTSTNNVASRGVAAKLGFFEVSRRVYVNMI